MLRLKRSSRLIYLLSFISLIACQNKEIPEYYVEGVVNPILNLNGSWYINTSPEEAFWTNNEINTNWKEIQVPGEVMMQGFYIKNDIPFAYKKEIEIPLDFNSKNIYLQFDGVYSYAKVWVNGNYVKDHHGGFTRWDCDITSFVTAGEKAWITVEVTDRADDISYASGYAKHQIGGILRDVNLVALPKNYPENIKIETDLDAQNRDANLIVSGELKNKGKNSEVRFQLFDAAKKEIGLKQNILLLQGENTFQINNTIINPIKWDAEHPNLYTLQVAFYENDEIRWSKSYSFGFREIQVVGNRLMVNGKSVKLRGACRHDNHPTLGRIATPEYELKDVILAKESNMNFIRTSHYPPSDNFLKLCDEYGIYVEDETAVCFVIDYRIKGYEVAANSQSDSTYTERYLSQIKEMVSTHQNHPSVIIWSIGNESNYGANFQESFDWLQENDKTRPVMFSYPGTAPDSVAPYQILSMHYPGINGDMEQYGKKTQSFGNKEMPVLFDEWAHVACYNNSTIQEDPNIRDFWGQSLDSMWTKTFNADGGLGGAIWGMIDETFMLPKDLGGFRDTWGINDNTVLSYQGTTIGYGEWGIVDVWRRKKPEFWNTKKSYSPIRILKTTIDDYQQDSMISVPIYNRFDHTNLNELVIKYTYKEKTEILKTFNIKPHEKGKFIVPISNWDPAEKIAIDFYDGKENLIDSYTIQQKGLKEVTADMELISNDKITYTDKKDQLIIHTKKGNLSLDKNTGLFQEINKEGKSMTISGPHMTYRTKGENITYSTNKINDYGKNWKLNEITYAVQNNNMVVNISGVCNEIKIYFELFIAADCKITTKYRYDNLPNELIREIGVTYAFDTDFDALSWERKPYWSSYPENHLSAATGNVSLFSKKINSYRKKPEKSWIEDTKSFYYDGTEEDQKNAFTFVAKALKENIIEYALLKKSKKWIVVNSNGTISCRLAQNKEQVELYLNNSIDYVDLSWGNYQRNVTLESGYYNGESEISLDPFFE